MTQGIPQEIADTIGKQAKPGDLLFDDAQIVPAALRETLTQNAGLNPYGAEWILYLVGQAAADLSKPGQLLLGGQLPPNKVL